MYDNYNYPDGADTPEAPWNEPIAQEKDINIDVEYVLRKSGVPVNIISEDDDLDIAYNERHYNIIELLCELKWYIKRDMKKSKLISQRQRKLKDMLKDCEGWEMYDKSYSESE